MAKQTYERKVLKGFKDKNTKKVYPKGSAYTSADPERINELVKKGHLSGDEIKVKESAQEENQDEVKAEDMTMDELKQIAESEGLEVEGTGKNGAIKKDDYLKALEDSRK